MPGRGSCCAPGGKNWRGKEDCKHVQFYRIPKVEKERLIWLARINGSDLRQEHVTDNTRLCSEHFYEGKKTKAQPLPVKFRHSE